MTRENRIGVVHWEALDVLGDGEEFTIAIPAFFESIHVPYLDGILAVRLAELFHGDQVLLTLVPGRLTQTETSSDYAVGLIRIDGVTEPWPDAAALRGVLDAAFVEAGELEVEQRRRGEGLARHLRVTDS